MNEDRPPAGAGGRSSFGTIRAYCVCGVVSHQMVPV